MKYFTLYYFILLFFAVKANAITFFTEGSRRQFNQQTINDLDMSSAKMGFINNGNGYGIWGEVERFLPDNYDPATNFELSALKTISFFNLTAAYGYSTDFHFKPSHLYLVEIQIPTSFGFTPYLGVSKEDYAASIVNNFVFYKIGAVTNFATGFSLLLQYQYIDNENQDRTINKVGSQIATSVTYTKLNHLVQIGSQFSCTGNSVTCDKSASRDEYLESNFIYRWWYNPNVKSWGLRGQITYVYQKSFIIREASSEIGRSSWTFRLGPQFEF